LAEIKAISIPEKNPMVIRQRITTIHELNVGIAAMILSKCTGRGSGI
jgi:hypothetical protein